MTDVSDQEQKLNDLYTLGQLKRIGAQVVDRQSLMPLFIIDCVFAGVISLFSSILWLAVYEGTGIHPAITIPLTFIGVIGVVFAWDYRSVRKEADKTIKDLNDIQSDISKDRFLNNYGIDFQESPRTIVDKADQAYDQLNLQLIQDEHFLATILEKIKNDEIALDNRTEKWIFEKSQKLAEKKSSKEKEKEKVDETLRVLKGDAGSESTPDSETQSSKSVLIEESESD